MKLNVYVPKDGSGNEESQVGWAYDPLPTDLGGARETDKKNELGTAWPTFCHCPGIPRPCWGW